MLMKIPRAKKTGQHGDTIVEVLISVAVASMVLASAYAITNRNVATTQDTQEHSQAQQIVQQQIEGLRVLSANGSLAAFVNGQCVTVGTATSPPSLSSNLCQQGPDGVWGSSCTEVPCYKVSIQINTASAYEISIKWDNVHGDTSSISMDYGI